MRLTLKILGEWLLFGARRRLPWWRLAAYVAVVMTVACVTESQLFKVKMPFTTDGHAIVSMNLAINASICKRPEVWSPKYHPGTFLAQNEWASYVPLRDVVARVAGSVEQYCASQMIPYANEDNSLGLVDTYALALNTNASAETIGRMLLMFRVGLIGVGSLALLEFGAGVVFTGAVAIVSLAISRDLHQFGMDFSGNAYFFILVWLNAATACSLVLLAPRVSRRWLLAGAFAVGFIAAASVNMRSSYLPIYLVFFVCSCAAVWWRQYRDASRWANAGLLIVTYVAGYVMFQYPFITYPAPKEGVATNTYHTVAHPLVLGLALPDNELSKAEGIKWVDEEGLPIARRIDPSVTFLGPGYERALFTYYKQLWRKYPERMKHVYLLKAELAGVHMLRSGNFIEPWMGPTLWPLSWIESGLWMFATFFGSFVIAAAVFAWRKDPLPLFVGFLCLGGAMLWVESAIIVPYYYVQYHSYLLFIALVWSLLVYQLAVNGVVSGLTWTGRGVMALARRWSR